VPARVAVPLPPSTKVNRRQRPGFGDLRRGLPVVVTENVPGVPTVNAVELAL